MGGRRELLLNPIALGIYNTIRVNALWTAPTGQLYLEVTAGLGFKTSVDSVEPEAGVSSSPLTSMERSGVAL